MDVAASATLLKLQQVVFLKQMCLVATKLKRSSCGLKFNRAESCGAQVFVVNQANGLGMTISFSCHLSLGKGQHMHHKTHWCLMKHG